MRRTVLGKYPALTKNECQNKHKGIVPLRVLCLCVFRKIVINCIKFKILFPAPFDSIRQSFTGAAGPENEFVAIAFPFLEIFDQCLVWLTKLRPFAVAESAIVAESKSVICQMYILQKRFGISTHSSNVESVLLQLYRLTCVCLKFL